jgi:hypothetical protein
MEKYRLVEEHKGEGEDFLEQTSESEVRITQQGKPRNYISYAMNLFVSRLVSRNHRSRLPVLETDSHVLVCSLANHRLRAPTL